MKYKIYKAGGLPAPKYELSPAEKFALLPEAEQKAAWERHHKQLADNVAWAVENMTKKKTFE